MMDSLSSLFSLRYSGHWHSVLSKSRSSLCTFGSFMSSDGCASGVSSASWSSQRSSVRWPSPSAQCADLAPQQATRSWIFWKLSSPIRAIQHAFSLLSKVLAVLSLTYSCSFFQSRPFGVYRCHWNEKWLFCLCSWSESGEFSSEVRFASSGLTHQVQCISR